MSEYDQATQTARDYYNSADADTFYAEVWGGEDIHVGLYKSSDEPIRDASRRTVDHLADRVAPLDAEKTVLDIGAGYGGAARRLAERFNCRVICLNLSEAENERNRQLNKQASVDDRIEVIDGSFEDIPLDDHAADVVWCQDAILHSGDRARVLEEVDRVLKPGGRFVFTDIMQEEGVGKEDLQPVLDRIHLDSLGSLAFYRREAKKQGLEEVSWADHTVQIANHYGRVHDITSSREGELDGLVSKEYIDRMKVGLNHWVDAGKAGRLRWGILVFRKPA